MGEGGVGVPDKLERRVRLTTSCKSSCVRKADHKVWGQRFHTIILA